MPSNRLKLQLSKNKIETRLRTRDHRQLKGYCSKTMVLRFHVTSIADPTAYLVYANLYASIAIPILANQRTLVCQSKLKAED